MLVHLDTDLGGDPDDACALAMLLGWPGIDLAGVTTNLDTKGRRAGCAAYCLELAGRDDVPVAAGAEASLTTRARYASSWGDARYWPEPIRPRPTGPGSALDLISSSIERGATIVAIGAYTNLALLEVMRPGSLDGVPVVAMGGWIEPPAAGLPPWGPERDFNVQCDTRAADILLDSAAELTLVPLPMTVRAHLRGEHLARLEAAGALGRLLAMQARAYAAERNSADMARRHPGLPDDLLNFQHDPLTCAMAVGWSEATVELRSLRTTMEDDVVRWHHVPAGGGRDCNVLVDFDASAFETAWLHAVEAADATQN